MKSFLLVLLGIVLGGIAGFFGGGAIGLGAGAGAGIVTGLQAGACLTLEAAREKGLITAEQEPEILARAGEMAHRLRAAASAFASEDLPEGPDTSKIDCAKVVSDLRKATSDTTTE